MDRKRIIRFITQKRIILFGAGNYAAEFYEDFKDILNISYCISNDSNQNIFTVGIDEICPVKRVVDYQKTECEYIILCAEDTKKMSNQMSDMGYLYGRDYIDSEFFRAVFGTQKIVLCYGVCYIRAVRNCLKSSYNFSEKYASWYFLDYLEKNTTEYFLFEVLLKICDVFIYNLYVSKEGIRQNKTYLKRISPKCLAIKIPLITFEGFYPKYVGNPVYKKSFCITSLQSKYSPFDNVDPVINELICQKRTAAEIKSIIGSLNYYEKDSLENNLEKELRKLELVERETDITIYPFIKRNLRTKRLFLNANHISNEIIVEIASQILKKLRLNDDLNRESLLNEILLYTSEVPIYPSVIEHLHLKQYNGDSQYKLFTFLGYQMVTFEEYIERYVEFCTTMKNYMERGYFNGIK